VFEAAAGKTLRGAEREADLIATLATAASLSIAIASISSEGGQFVAADRGKPHSD